MVLNKTEVFMEATISKWGNSQEIHIPKKFINALGISHDTPLNINLKNDEIIILNYKHQSLAERVKKSCRPLSFSHEIDWGDPVGDEIW